MHMKFPINTETMEFLLLHSVGTIETKRSRFRVFLELIPSTRERKLNLSFKPLFI